MSKTKLSYIYSCYYKVIAIATHLKNYRVSFYINESHQISLERKDDLAIIDSLKAIAQHYEQQSFIDENMGLEYYLIHNKSKGNFFLSSLKKFDFVLLIKSESEITIQDELIEKLKKIKHFQVVYKPEKISVKENRIIEKNILYKDFD